MSRRFRSAMLLLALVLITPVLVAPVHADVSAPAESPALPHTTLGDQPLRAARFASSDHSTSTTPVVKPLEGLDLTRVGGALVAVIALIFLLRWFGKVFFPAATGKAQSRVVEVVSRSPLAPKQQVMLLRIGKRLLVVGDSGGQLSTLCEISDADEVASMVGQIREEKSSTGPAAFGSLFGRFSRKFEPSEAEMRDPPDPTDRQMLIDDTDEIHEPATARAEIDGLRDRVRKLAEQFNKNPDLG